MMRVRLSWPLTKTTPARVGATAGIGLAVLVAGLLSLLWWRADASACRCEYCPDGYCEYAQWLGAALTRWDTASLIGLREFSRDYIHAHNPLGPLLQALVVLLIPHPLVAYMVVSGAASLFAGFAMRRVVAATGSPPPGLGALLLAAFYTHVLVIRAFARPIGDALGMACTIGVLWALQRYLKTRTTRAAVLLLGAQVAGLFSRVSLIPMLGMSVLGELLVPGSFPQRARRALRSGVLFGLIPAALFLGINAILGTLHLRWVWEFAHREDFTGAYTVRDFLASLTIAGQGYAVLVIALLSRDTFASVPFRLHLLWVALYGVFLALGGGALWPRYFLPIVPSFFVLAAPVLCDLARRRPWNTRLLIGTFIVGNLLYVHPVSGDVGPAARLLLSDLRARIAGWYPSATLPLIPPTELTVTTNHEVRRAGLAADGNLDTSWATARSQGPGVYVQADLGTTRAVCALSLWTTLSEYPQGYAIDASPDGVAWSRLASGQGARQFIGFLDELPRLFVPFPCEPARYLRISSTIADRRRWGIHELAVHTRGGAAS